MPLNAYSSQQPRSNSGPVSIFAPFDPTPQPPSSLRSSLGSTSLRPAMSPRSSIPAEADHPALPGSSIDALASPLPNSPLAPSKNPALSPTPTTGGGESASHRITDPELRRINEHEESRLALSIERQRRAREAATIAATRTAEAKARNLKAEDDRREAAMKDPARAKNFRVDPETGKPVPLSAKERVAAGSKSRTDAILAEDDPAKRREMAELDMAEARGAQNVRNDVYSMKRQSALDKVARVSKMRQFGLKPGDALDEAHFDDLLRLAR